MKLAKEEMLLLENQLCFPLYAASRLVTQLYTPLLKKLDITYPQYLVLLVLWEQDGRMVSELSSLLYLESNTLTPLLKRMEKKGLLERRRSKEDERKVIIRLTETGNQLKEEAFCVPQLILDQFGESDIATQELLQFKTTLSKMIALLAGQE